MGPELWDQASEFLLDQASKFLWQVFSNVKNPVLYTCSKLLTSLPDGLLEDGKIKFDKFFENNRVLGKVVCKIINRKCLFSWKKVVLIAIALIHCVCLPR